LDATAGSTIYIDLGESGAPLVVTEALSVPPGVNIEGHGIDRTIIEYNGAGGAATDGVFVLADGSSTHSVSNKIEKLTIREGADCDGVSAIIGGDYNATVLDHLKILTTFDCVRQTSSAAGTMTVENSRIVSSSGAAVRLSGAAHTGFVVGDHPYTKGATAVILGNGARCTMEGLAETSGSYVFDVDGVGSLLSAAGCNFDLSLVRTTNSGVIRTEENVADCLLDRTAGVETNWSLRKWFRVMGSILAGKSSGVASGSPVYRDLNDTKNRVSGTASDGDRSSVTYDGT